MRLAHRMSRHTLLVKIILVALLGAALSVGLGAQAQAAPGDEVCSISRGGKQGSYLCRYGYTNVIYDGRRHTFVVGTNDAVWHIWQTSVNGPYSNWTSLGGVARSDVLAWTYSSGGAPALGINVKGTDGRDWCKWYNLSSNRGNWTPSQLTWSRC